MQAVTIGNEQIAAFRRDGVIVLRGVFRDWIEPLRDGFEQVLAAPGPFAIENVVVMTVPPFRVVDPAAVPTVPVSVRWPTFRLSAESEKNSMSQVGPVACRVVRA